MFNDCFEWLNHHPPGCVDKERFLSRVFACLPPHVGISVVHLTLDGVNGKWRWRRNLCQIDGNAVIYDRYLRCHFWMTPYVHNTGWYSSMKARKRVSLLVAGILQPGVREVATWVRTLVNLTPHTHTCTCIIRLCRHQWHAGAKHFWGSGFQEESIVPGYSGEGWWEGWAALTLCSSTWFNIVNLA